MPTVVDPTPDEIETRKAEVRPSVLARETRSLYPRGCDGRRGLMDADQEASPNSNAEAARRAIRDFKAASRTKGPKIVAHEANGVVEPTIGTDCFACGDRRKNGRCPNTRCHKSPFYGLGTKTPPSPKVSEVIPPLVETVKGVDPEPVREPTSVVAVVVAPAPIALNPSRLSREINAIRCVSEALEGLEPESVARVLAFLAPHLGLSKAE